MIVRSLKEILATEREVRAENNNWVSRRFLLKKDNMGFSLHDTIIYKGTQTHIHYKNHLEAVYCIEGSGEIEDLDNQVTHKLEPGVMYALINNEKHILRAFEELRLICVFNPPITGNEIHLPDGSYPIIDE